ncbi:MAG: glycosyltransferase family 4 protein [Pseudomonadota bacterium]|nr:glycosyltransferase family 4 protein [Pseudomonadota bacterium]
MKIAVLNSMAPFVWGGAEELASHLVANLRRLGHKATLYRIPFAWDPFSSIPREMARSKAVRLSGFDRVISMKFPIYLCDADRHSTWLVHQYRQAYDLWDSPYCNIPHTKEGEAVRQLIIQHDNDALRNRDSLFTISSEVSRRLKSFNGIDAPPLRAPINDPELFTGGADEGYILAPGRINASKRQSLLVEAMAHAGTKARLIVAGPPETEEDARGLKRLVEQHRLGPRVKLDLRFLTRQELADYVNNSRAVAYLPFEEDSYGYVTMEAFEAGKPVITTTDAGELLDLVRDQVTGLVCEPRPKRLAEAIASYTGDKKLALEHGQAGQAVWRGTGINWPDNIQRLLGE